MPHRRPVAIEAKLETLRHRSAADPQCPASSGKSGRRDSRCLARTDPSLRTADHRRRIDRRFVRRGSALIVEVSASQRTASSGAAGPGNAVNSGLEQTEGDLVLVGDEQHGVRADDLRRLWHSYTEQPAAEERRRRQSLAVAHVGRPGALVRKDARLEAQSPADAGRHSGARSCPVERVASRRPRLPAASSGGWTTARIVAARRAVVHPLYLEQRRRLADQPERQSVARPIVARSTAGRQASSWPTRHTALARGVNHSVLLPPVSDR